jgi:Xaa-Pro aminopeptidase
LFKVQKDVFDSLLEILKPGVTVRELAELTEKTGNSSRPKSGPAANALVKLTMHGRGAGDDGPIITDSSQNERDLNVALKENMVLIFKPSAETAPGVPRSICTWGDTVVVTKSGGMRLGTFPHELAVSGR